MKIEKITKLKNGKYKIKLDTFEFITYDDIIINHGLLYKKDVDNELFNKLSLETSYYDVYNKSVKYCMKRIRSENEVRKYLDKLEVSKEDLEKIIDKLKGINLINDRIYVRSYINDKIYLSKDSINKIKNDLNEQSIDKNIIAKEISELEYDDLEKLEKLVIKRINTNHRYSNYMLKNKVVSEMKNLGYNYDDIISIFDKNINDNYDILVKEYNKLYNKYSKKYQGNELEYFIKNKLYAKGFNYDDIKKEDLHL